MAAPLPSDEEARLADLRDYHLLDTDPEDAYDDITRLAAFICGTPIAAVSLMDAHRQWFKSILGLTASETPRDIAFCAHTILQPNVMIVPDATKDPRFASNPLVTGDTHIRFYAGIPLISEEGHALGSLCVIDTKPKHLSPEQETALKTLAHQVTSQFALARKAAAQEQLLAEREAAEKTLAISELRYRRLFETAQDGILILDAATAKITNANPFMAKLLSYSQDEFLGKELWEIGLLRDKTASQEAFRKLQQDGYIRYESLPLETRTGARRDVEFVSNLYRENGHRVIQCNIRDITARKAGEEALRVSEQFAQATLDGLSSEIAILDEGGNILAVNYAWRQFGADNSPVAQNAAESTNYLQVCDVTEGQELEDARQVAEGIRAVAAGRQELFTLEYPCHSPQEQRWFNMRATRFPGDGPVRVVVSHENVTQRKIAEIALEKALTVAKAQADHDPLTELFNHRVFHKKLDLEATRALREKTNLAVVMMDINNFKFFNDVYGHAAGDDVLRIVAGRLRTICRPYDVLARLGGDEFALLLPHVGHVGAGEVEARLRVDLENLSYRTDNAEATIPIMVSLGAALFPEASANSQDVLHQADERLLWSKTGGGAQETARWLRLDTGARVQGFSMMDALVTAVDNKDRYTRKHSEDVMAYSLMMGREMDMDERQQQTVAVAALLHDVGKIGVPDAILRKPGKLTDEEFEAVKQHPQMGAVIVGAVPGLEETLDAVRHHHERWDGGGYPFGLREKETPLIARLMAVADAYSAMTTDRPYRKGMDTEKAQHILAEGAGTQWDPACVQVFLKVMRSAESPLSFPVLPA